MDAIEYYDMKNVFIDEMEQILHNLKTSQSISQPIKEIKNILETLEIWNNDQHEKDMDISLDDIIARHEKSQDMRNRKEK